jgi:hypothetical protein
MVAARIWLALTGLRAPRGACVGPWPCWFRETRSRDQRHHVSRSTGWQVLNGRPPSVGTADRIIPPRFARYTRYTRYTVTPLHTRALPLAGSLARFAVLAGSAIAGEAKNAILDLFWTLKYQALDIMPIF